MIDRDTEWRGDRAAMEARIGEQLERMGARIVDRVREGAAILEALRLEALAPKGSPGSLVVDPDFVRPWNKGYLVWCVGLLGGMLALEPVVRVACEAVLDGRTPRPLALVRRCVGVMEVQGGELSGDSYFWWWILPMGLLWWGWAFWDSWRRP